jgi:hypothetical protein
MGWGSYGEPRYGLGKCQKLRLFRPVIYISTTGICLAVALRCCVVKQQRFDVLHKSFHFFILCWTDFPVVPSLLYSLYLALSAIQPSIPVSPLHHLALITTQPFVLFSPFASLKICRLDVSASTCKFHCFSTLLLCAICTVMAHRTLDTVLSRVLWSV